MKRLSQTTQLSRDIKKMKKSGKDLGKLRTVVKKLASGPPLLQKNRDHALVGSWQPSRDCHIEPDWILIYTTDEKTLRLERTGTHSDIFMK
ncbi:MAG: type II toxin-antitoxin system mRNA interferase toxin, RelE/StbE family [Verrucomicrobia bacterium]|nr:MAG: type II toxin-antitoxin system mRNA interferase toxin, RelE/StbE family [Verrucomicrobiota bacterium]